MNYTASDHENGSIRNTERAPRISINKLAEYMGANALRRRQIVKDAKAPSNFIVSRYGEARRISREYFTSHLDKELLSEAIQLLSSKEALTDFQKDDKTNSILSLEYLQAMDMPDLSEYEVRLLEGVGAVLDLEGVSVSVNPDLLLYNTNTSKFGALKLHLSKSNLLQEEGRRTVATVLRYYLEVTQFDAIPAACFSVDVFAGKFSNSPSAYKQTMKRVEASCREIRLHWMDV